MSHMINDSTTKLNQSRPRLLLAHGAGAPMDSSFMDALVAALDSLGVDALRFEFPYMAKRREDGVRRPPNPMPVLLDCFREQFYANGQPVFIGGKSLGGRVASLLADELQAPGLICFGYPFHPQGKPEKLRTEHLRTLTTPALILQGTRDPLGKPEEVASYGLSKHIEVSWLESGDHDFKPLKRSGLTQDELIEQSARLTADFIRQRSQPKEG